MTASSIFRSCLPQASGLFRRLLCVTGLAITCFCAPPLAADDVPKFVLPDTNDGLPGNGPIRRYDWFRNVWQNRRATFAKEAATGNQQGAVVFLGDSITQGWQQDMMNMFGPMKLANRGISGDTTRGMLIRLHDDVLNLKPAAVVMLMGTNDLEEGASPETIAGNIRLIMQTLTETNADMPIVYCNVMPSSESKKRPAAKIQAINAAVADFAKTMPQVTIVDTYTLFANKQGDAKPEEFPDLLHPNKAGYEKWAKALRPILATLGFLEQQSAVMTLPQETRWLFNGNDLTGWGFRPTTDAMKKAHARWKKNNPAAPPWPIVEQAVAFDGKTQSTDGRYKAIAGRLVVTTPSEGRLIQQLWTTEEFEGDFVLELQFRATPNADSGVFIRGPQLQCRDYKLAGPYKNLKNYREGEWNDLKVDVTGSTAVCTCNGEVIEEAFKVPPKGPIGLEGDRGQIEYRWIRITPKP